MNIVDEILFVWAAVAVNIYVVVYMTRPWWVTSAGRALMVKAWGNLILVDLGIATMLFGRDYPGRDLVRTFGFGVFGLGMWLLLIVLLRTPLYPRPRERDQEKEDAP